ncbi:flagellar export chaperone FliS [Cryptosporangium arvum]|uniref:Flagellar secretion chaperone FliS n=1 Tax=Cryptosporangium arvum DSM 44712 TaxID=927661 RepID=A0A010Z0K2_9ACTN|nr:flagellar export chaperone FliS [Cryptosporangium arvum]EXG80983.1 flagellar biosynthetic protein FliS [Cryptosporangium arvum DSM 44712]
MTYPPPGAARARYLADSISTASPARLLVMLYDRLVQDIAQGEQAIREGNRLLAGERLMHAQDIISELLATLDLTAWDGAENVAALYRWMLSELVQANIKQDAGKAASTLELANELRDAWREAAMAVGSA